MSVHNGYDDGEEEEQLSGSENDDAFDDDMEALRRACMITGTNPESLENDRGGDDDASGAGGAASGEGVRDEGGNATESESEDDLELFRNIRNRFSLSVDVCEPLFTKPLCTLPPADSDEDDFETLRAIQRRFSAYDVSALENGTSSDMFVNRTNASEGFPDSERAYDAVPHPEQAYHKIPDSVVAYNTIPGSEEGCNSVQSVSENWASQPSGVNELHSPDAGKSSTLQLGYSTFPEPAQMFIDAIKKNRSYQRFLRSKLTHIEAKLEENKKLKQRVKILRDFQVSCKKMTGRALSQKKDPCVQLISARKSGTSDDSEVNDKKVSAIHFGPAENSHVANYRMALTKFPLSLIRKKWSRIEKENLAKGIRQQFQEMLLNVSIDRFSGSKDSSGDTHNLDNILLSIKDLQITPEMIRQCLPKINWDNLASMYVVGRSGAECEVQWLNWEDPLINRDPWTAEEDKNLLFIIQERGIKNWLDIAVSLGTNRTPFQCLARYQRSLNACILKREWTEDEDDELREAVGRYGEHDWQSVASALRGRTGPQCSNRWKKSLHPTRLRVGRWTLEENKRLKVAVLLFGPKNWKKIAQFVPGRTQVQCRERWVNSLDPSLNLGEWTEEEDSKLKAAVAEHGYSWSKVASHLPSRTDNQCWRRWKVLVPHEATLIQEARKIRKAALICNFVDRESQRPALGPNDFIPLPKMSSVSELGNTDPCKKPKRRLRKKLESENVGVAAPSNVREKIRSRRSSKGAESCSEQFSGTTNGNEVEISGGTDAIFSKNSTSVMTTNGGADTTRKKKFPGSHSWKHKHTTPVGDSQNHLVLPPESFESGTSNDIEVFQRNNAISSEKKEAPKQLSRKRMCAELGEEQNFVCSEKAILPSDATTVHDHSSSLDPTLVTSNEEAFRPGGVDASKSRASKRRSKRKMLINLDADDFSSGDVTSNKESRAQRQHGGNGSSDKESGRTERQVGTMSLREAVNMDLESDFEAGNITLAHFMHRRLKKKPTIASSIVSTILSGDEEPGRVEITGESLGFQSGNCS